MAEKKVVKKEVVEEKPVAVKNSPAAQSLQAVFDAYKERNPDKAKSKEAEFAEKLEALNK